MEDNARIEESQTESVKIFRQDGLYEVPMISIVILLEFINQTKMTLLRFPEEAADQKSLHVLRPDKPLGGVT